MQQLPCRLTRGTPLARYGSGGRDAQMPIGRGRAGCGARLRFPQWRHDVARGVTGCRARFGRAGSPRAHDRRRHRPAAHARDHGSVECEPRGGSGAGTAQAADRHRWHGHRPAGEPRRGRRNRRTAIRKGERPGAADDQVQHARGERQAL